MPRWIGLALFLAVSGASVPALAQQVISAQAGLIHYVEGQAFQGEEPVVLKASTFPSLKAGETLRTAAGRAEVLLNPGVFLRLAEQSAVRMLDTRLTNTRVEVESGSVLVEAGLQDPNSNQVFLLYRDVTIHLRKSGIFRLDTDPPALRVYEGEALVRKGDDSVTLKKGRVLPLEGMMAAGKFDPKVGDPFYRWAARRAEYLSLANISAAKRARDGDLFWGGGSGWVFNPYFGMFTYLPGGGGWLSPFGYRFYSPRTVYQVFERPTFASDRMWDRPAVIPQSRSGYAGVRSSAGMGAGAAASPSSSAGAAPSAPIRGGEGRAGGSGR
jgi:hypothetical protein